MNKTNPKFQPGQTVMYQYDEGEYKEVTIDEYHAATNTYRINNPSWDWDEEAAYVGTDNDYDVPYWLWVEESELSEIPTSKIN